MGRWAEQARGRTGGEGGGTWLCRNRRRRRDRRYSRRLPRRGASCRRRRSGSRAGRRQALRKPENSLRQYHRVRRRRACRVDCRMQSGFAHLPCRPSAKWRIGLTVNITFWQPAAENFKHAPYAHRCRRHRQQAPLKHSAGNGSCPRPCPFPLIKHMPCRG